MWGGRFLRYGIVLAPKLIPSNGRGGLTLFGDRFDTAS